jgi:hypothetical protein
MDASTVSRIGVPALNRLRGYADGGFVQPPLYNSTTPFAAPLRSAPAGSGAVTINVSTPAGTAVQATQSTAPDGSKQIDMKVFARMMDDTVASGIRSRQSATHGAIMDTFGVNDKL